MILQGRGDEKSSALDFAVAGNALRIRGNTSFFEILLNPVAKRLDYSRILVTVGFLGRTISARHGKSPEVQGLHTAWASNQQGSKIDFVDWSFRRSPVVGAGHQFGLVQKQFQ